MFIIYFINQDSINININNIIYDLIFSFIKIDDDLKILLTSYIKSENINDDFIKLSTNEIVKMFNFVKLKSTIVENELHFINLDLYEYINKYSLKFLFEQQTIQNEIILKFIEDYIYNFLNFEFNHSSIELSDNNIIKAVYICKEKKIKKKQKLFNYFSIESIKNNDKFFKFCISLKNLKFSFDNNFFIN